MLAFMLVVVLSRPLVGQATVSTASLKPGARVRVTLLEAEPRVGMVVGSIADTLLVRFPEFSNADHVPLDAISQIEVSAGGARNLLKGAALGTLAGAGIGALLGASAKPKDFVGKGTATASASVGCAMLGLIVGTFAALWRGEDWREVAAKPRRIEAGVAPGRVVGLAVSLQF
jgi:hypothetical protein